MSGHASLRYNLTLTATGADMRPTLCLIAFLLACTTASTRAQEKPVQLAHLFVYGDFLFAEGVFRADILNENTELAFDTVTRIECYKHGGTLLVDSDAYCLQGAASIAFGVPNIDITYFPIVTWDNDKVIAAASSTAALPICTWTQITVNLHDHSVMATDTRKLGKGHEGFNNSCEAVPLAQTYHLMDTPQELARRRLRAAQTKKESTK
jgi:hypothetical protein